MCQGLKQGELLLLMKQIMKNRGIIIFNKIKESIDNVLGITLETKCNKTMVLIT